MGFAQSISVIVGGYPGMGVVPVMIPLMWVNPIEIIS